MIWVIYNEYICSEVYYISVLQSYKTLKVISYQCLIMQMSFPCIPGVKPSNLTSLTLYF